MAELAGQPLDASHVGPLMAGLQASSIPNPQTPKVRDDLKEQMMLDWARIWKSLDIALEPSHPGSSDEIMGHLLFVLRATAALIKNGADGMTAMKHLQSEMQAAPPPGVAGTPGLPPVQPGPAVGAPPGAGATPLPPGPDTSPPGA